MAILSKSKMVVNALVRLTLAVLVTSAGAPVGRAQQPSPQGDVVVGTWILVSEVLHQGDKTTEPLGPHPLGSMMLDRGGRFMLMIARPGLPKFAANKRDGGTPEENKAVLGGSLSFFGTYSASGGVLTLHVEASTFPNWVGTDQKRIFTIAGDELRWTNRTPAVRGEVADLMWRRAK